MPNWDDAAKIMVENGWLSLTPPSFPGAVLQRCRLQRHDAGETIYRVGDPPGGMVGLLSRSSACRSRPARTGPVSATRQPRRVGLTVPRSAALLHLPLAKIDEIVAAEPAAWRCCCASPAAAIRRRRRRAT